MKYPVAIERGSDTTAWGVVVPDLHGCFAAVDSGLDDALENVREAITLWLEEAVAHGKSIPLPSRIDALTATGQFDGWIWAVVEVDPVWLDESDEDIHIALPRRILALLDSRATYTAQLALQAQASSAMGS